MRLTNDNDNLRIDRWLYYCRLYKTRTLAQAAVGGGHVKLNGERPAPGSRVRRSDEIELVKERLPYRLTVRNIPARRGPAAEARSCYDEDPATVTSREDLVAALKQDRMLTPRTAGRPDKHTRRKLRDRRR